MLDVEWNEATPTEVRNSVLWLKLTAKPQNSPRTQSKAKTGAVNPVTRKRYLGDRYEPTTVRHGDAVICSYYAFWVERPGGQPDPA